MQLSLFEVLHSFETIQIHLRFPHCNVLFVSYSLFISYPFLDSLHLRSATSDHDDIYNSVL